MQRLLARFTQYLQARRVLGIDTDTQWSEILVVLLSRFASFQVEVHIRYETSSCKALPSFLIRKALLLFSSQSPL